MQNVRHFVKFPPITNQSDFVGSLENKTIKVGQFNMEIVQIEKSGSTYNGEGLVEIPFIRKVKLKTSFSNIKINTDKVVYQGIVTGKESGNELETLNTLLFGATHGIAFWLGYYYSKHTSYFGHNRNYI